MFILSAAFASGQTFEQVISVGGADSTRGNIQLSWTIGEPIIETGAAPTAALTQGFHQTNITVTDAGDSQSSNKLFSVFPIPTGNKITINNSGDVTARTNYSLVDPAGRVVLSGKFDSKSIDVDCSELSSGAYFLKLEQNDKTINTFKIVKQ